MQNEEMTKQDLGRENRVLPRTATVEPPLYKVIMHNDDYTPMDFVVAVLEEFFHMDKARATAIMLEVHTKGKAVCGTFSRDVAETKAGQVAEHALSNEHPLLCSVEGV